MFCAGGSSGNPTKPEVADPFSVNTQNTASDPWSVSGPSASEASQVDPWSSTNSQATTQNDPWSSPSTAPKVRCCVCDLIAIFATQL